MSTNKNRFIQYELWKDCKNNCAFCFNKNQPDLNKVASLLFVTQKMQEPEVDENNEIGFIGGEFFDGQLCEPRVKQLFYNLFDICAEKVKANKINKIYITTSLLFDANIDLIPFLNYLQKIGILKYTLLCTSYDLKYRFHTKDRLKLWEANMILLNKIYPELKLHSEIILTKFFIDAVLKDEFNITDFSKKFNTSIDYIEPASGFYYRDKQDMQKHIPDFFPTKQEFIKFLKKTAIENKEIELYKFLSMEIRSNTVYCYLNNQLIYLSDRRKNNEGFIKAKETSNIKYEIGMIDSEEKMRDVVIQLLNTLGED